MKFSEKLQTLRKENKLSQEKLADMLDVSRQAVSKWESGQTYPEMDKLLTMCKIFGCSLDELTNDEITDIGGNNKNKNTTSNLVDEVLEIINRTCKVFRKLQFKDITKIVFEMLIVVGILLIFSIPIQYIYSLGRDIFMNFGVQIGNMLSSIFKFVLGVSYFILSIIIFVYIYKIRVLDHYENNYDEESIEKIEDKKTNSVNNNDVLKVERPKREIIIKKEHNYAIFKTLGSIVMAFIKFFVLCMGIPFVFTMLFLFAALILSIIVIFKGVFFLGIILGILSCILLNIVLLEIAFNFIFNKKNSVKRLFIMFITAIAVLGISTGITMWDFANINYIEEVPSNFEKNVYETVYPMNDNTVFLDMYYDNVYYNIDDSMGDDIRIEISYYKDYLNVYATHYDQGDINIHQSANTQSIKKMIDLVLSDLSHRQLYLYNGLYDCDINIYTSSKNKEKLLANKEKYLKEMEEKNYNEQLQQYYNRINEYESRIDTLKEEYEQKINDLESKKQELTDKNQELQDKIQEYEERIKEYRDSINDLLKN